MINFDSLSLKALVNELSPVLIGGRIHKVQQPGKNEILLSIRASGKNHKLYFSVVAKYPHVTCLSKEGEELRCIENPQFPPMFCMLLRKHMEGAKIQAIKQPTFERILEIHFESYSEVGERVPMVLACEFMGKHSNIILYNYETNVIMGCAHNVSAEKSREREVAGGLPYIYPPKQLKLDINSLSEQEFLGLIQAIPEPINIWLSDKFGYISKALATELCNNCEIETKSDKIAAVSQEKLSCLYELAKQTVNLENLNPSISKDSKLYSPIGIDKDTTWLRMENINSMLDMYFGQEVFKEKFSAKKNSISDVVKKELKKKKKLAEKHTSKVNADEKLEKHREQADLIMANLYRIQTGAEFVELENIYKDNESIKIQLDPTLSPNANAQKYYKLYNKAKTAKIHSEELLKGILEEIQYFESVKESIKRAESFQDLTQIRQELVDQKIINQKEQKKKAKDIIQLIEFVSTDGYTILAGKNNKQNDYILKHSSPDDIWMHTLEIPGSHVLIKHKSDEEVPETTLHEAVYISSYFSQARESSNVPVVYTKRKYVKKPSGAKPGFVIYTHEKTLWVNPQDLLEEDNKILSLRRQ